MIIFTHNWKYLKRNHSCESHFQPLEAASVYRSRDGNLNQNSSESFTSFKKFASQKIRNPKLLKLTLLLCKLSTGLVIPLCFCLGLGSNGVCDQGRAGSGTYSFSSQVAHIHSLPNPPHTLNFCISASYPQCPVVTSHLLGKNKETSEFIYSEMLVVHRPFFQGYLYFSKNPVVKQKTDKIGQYPKYRLPNGSISYMLRL